MKLRALFLLTNVCLILGNVFNEERKRSIADQLSGLANELPVEFNVIEPPASEYFLVTFVLDATTSIPPTLYEIQNVKKISTVNNRTVVLVKTEPSKTEVLRQLRSNGIMNYKVEFSVQQSFSTTWDLDRIDQPTLPLNNQYISIGTAPGVHVYIVDTGIRHTHEQFSGRVVKDYVVEGESTSVCNNHGTWVAGLAAGVSTGPASSAIIHDLKVARSSLSCAFYTSDGIDALLWILSNGTLPGVINLSWQGPGNSVLDDILEDLYNMGFVIVSAGGNAGSITAACENSPARSSFSLTTGATQSNDYLPSWSNYGVCIDIYAPGVGVVGASAENDYALISQSGTSGSTPLVTGVAAVYYSKYGFTSASEVTNMIRNTAVYGVIQNLAVSPANRFLNIAAMVPPPPPPPPSPPTNGMEIKSVF